MFGLCVIFAAVCESFLVEKRTLNMKLMLTLRSTKWLLLVHAAFRTSQLHYFSA